MKNTALKIVLSILWFLLIYIMIYYALISIIVLSFVFSIFVLYTILSSENIIKDIKELFKDNSNPFDGVQGCE